MVCHSLDGYPLEVCGLLVGIEEPEEGGSEPVSATEAVSAREAGTRLEAGARRGTGQVALVVPTENVAASSKVYEIAPKSLLEVDRTAEAAGLQIIGVYHSHTHTEAKPSPTDIESAPDPSWHYVLVSLRDSHPSLRSWKIEAGKIEEEKVVVKW